MTIRTALDASRNIPAIKMFYLATQDATSTGAEQEYNLVEYLRNLGLTSIEHRPDNQLYWPPIALGSAEVRPLDFIAAYAAIANNGQYMKPNPIAYILDSQGNQITLDQESPRQAMVPAAAYMITHILSDNDARPPGWNNFLALASNRKAAVKTGTSSKKVGEATYPRDLWTVWYTPQIATAVWTGNTDGKSASARASGMESSALIWKKFMDFAHKDLPKKDFVRPDDVWGNDVFLYIQNQKPNILKSFNPEKIQIDTLCNGKVDAQTPKEAIRDAFILDAAFPIEDTHPAWRESVNAWLGSEGGRSYLIAKLWITENMMMVVAPPANICDRPSESIPQFTSTLTDGIELFSGLYPIEIDYRSDHPMKEAQVLINDVFYRSVSLQNNKEGKVKIEFSVSLNEWVNQIVTLRVIDTFGYSTSRNYAVKILDKDDQKPIIKSDSPLSISVTVGESVNISGIISDLSQIPKIQVFVDNIIYGTFTDTKKYALKFETPKDLPRWQYDITVQATDFQKNIGTLSYEVIVR